MMKKSILKIVVLCSIIILGGFLSLNYFGPILIVHGDNDKRINIKYGKINYQHIASIQKEFVEVHNATHLNVWRVGGKSYLNKVFTFLDEHKKSE